MRLTEQQTNELIVRLEERCYGHRLNSMRLAQKANVPLDMVNRVENQLPIDEVAIFERIAKALGVTPALLRKVAGYAEMSDDELQRLDVCLAAPATDRSLQGFCQELGLLPLPMPGERAA